MKKILLSLLAALIMAYPARAQRDSLRISLITCEPGAAIYELYGHTAIRVQDFTKGQDVVFNYGLFDFNTPHFIWRFCLGKTDYLLGAQRMSGFMEEYDERGSAIWEQELNLSPDENSRLYNLLIENSLPENRVYRYNFLYGNCATMAVDKIEQSINGKVTYPAPTDGQSFRSILTRHTAVKPWSQFAVDLVVGAEADRQLKYRQEAFAPLLLKDLASKAQIRVVTDSTDTVRTLVSEPVRIVSPDHSVDFGRCLLTPLQTMWLALLITVFISLLGWYRNRRFLLYDIILFSIQGLAGLIIAFLFFLSEHPAVDTNWLIIILNPLPLLLLPFAVHRIRKGHFSWFFPAEFIVTATFAACSHIIPQYIEPAVTVLSATFAIRALSTTLFNLSVTPHVPRRKNRKGKAIAALCLALPACLPASAQTIQHAPKLVVGIVLDQFDMECLNRLKPILRSDGFLKLMDQGYCLDNAGLDFQDPDLASGTAAILSGTVPYMNGIVASRWMIRKNMMPAFLADDSNYMGSGTDQFTSPARLMSSNLADCIKLSSGGKSKICSIAIEREAAVFAGGHEADVALWMNPQDCSWCTSDYYGGLPAWVQQVASDRKNNTWEPLVPVEAFSHKSVLDIPKAFSYSIRSDNGADYRTSPIANTRVSDMALKAIDAMGLGLDQNPDLLLLSMYAGNFRQQSTDFWSHEQQDIYLRLDQEIARLISDATLKAGSENVLFFLTSAGNRKQYAASLQGTRIPNGTVSMERLTALLNLYLSAKYDCPTLAKAYYHNQIFLDRKAIEDKGLDIGDILDSSIDLLTQASGVSNVILLRDLMSVLPDSETAQLRNSMNPSFSGDIILKALPGWSIVDEVQGYTLSFRNMPDTFPIILYGYGIRKYHSNEPVSALRLAPTISLITGSEMPNACSERPLDDIFE